MLKCLYLHIGLEKTGTTSIQEFLHINREALAAAGNWLPGSLGHKNHKLLAAYGLEAGSRDIAVTAAGIGSSPEAVAEFRAGLRERLLKDAVRGRDGVGIISSEDLSRLHKASEVQRVVDLLREFTAELRVIVFVRRQDLLAASRYYSLVLGGSVDARVMPQPGEGPPYYDYRSNIGLWADAVGAERVILKRFPEVPKREGFNSVNAFRGLIGIEGGDYADVQEQHVSFDAVNQILMQGYNQLRGGYDAQGLAWLMERLAPMNDRSLGQIPSEQQARQFYGTYRQGNLALFRRLGVEDQMFSEDFSMYPAENMRAKFHQMGMQRLLSLLEAQRGEDAGRDK